MSDRPENTHDWPEPESLSIVGDVPPFPAGYLPPALRDHVDADAEELQVANALPGILALAACSVALQGKVRVEVTPNWHESLNVYAVVSMEPSARKSPAYKHAMAPHEEWQRERAEATASEVAASIARHDSLKLELERAKKKLAEADPGDREDLLRRLDELAHQVAAYKPLATPRLFADDVTPERLAMLLYEQGGRLAIAGDEGGGTFDIMSGRYSKDSAPNLDIYLKAYDGGTLRVDRVGRPSLMVEEPLLTIAVTTQPDVLNGLGGRDGFRGRGLLGRFLYAVPPSNLGSRKADSPITPGAVREAYRKVMRSLLEVPERRTPDGRPDPYIVKLGAEATGERLEFRAWLEPQLAKHGPLGHVGDWAGKLEAMTVRIAGLLHMARNAGDASAWQAPIRFESFYYARRIAEDFLIPHALAAFGEMGADPQLEGARYIGAWVKTRRLDCFSKRDAWQALRGRFGRAGELDGPLALLEECHWIARLPEEDRTGVPGKRPSPRFEVNPRLFSDQGRGVCGELGKSGYVCGNGNGAAETAPGVARA